MATPWAQVRPRHDRSRYGIHCGRFDRRLGNRPLSDSTLAVRCHRGPGGPSARFRRPSAQNGLESQPTAHSWTALDCAGPRGGLGYSNPDRCVRLGAFQPLLSPIPFAYSPQRCHGSPRNEPQMSRRTAVMESVCPQTRSQEVLDWSFGPILPFPKPQCEGRIRPNIS